MRLPTNWCESQMYPCWRSYYFSRITVYKFHYSCFSPFDQILEVTTTFLLRFLFPPLLAKVASHCFHNEIQELPCHGGDNCFCFVLGIQTTKASLRKVLKIEFRPYVRWEKDKAATTKRIWSSSLHFYFYLR